MPNILFIYLTPLEKIMQESLYLHVAHLQIFYWCTIVSGEHKQSFIFKSLIFWKKIKVSFGF
jgi:hypothetical protein